MNKKANKRFWDKVARKGEHECWEWIGNRYVKGYGRFATGGRQYRANRFAYEIAVGQIPDGLWVLHHCDNPPCCNPNHLFLGVHADNMADRHAKGRHFNTRKNACLRGHPFSEENTIWKPHPFRHGESKRECRICKKMRNKARRRQATCAVQKQLT